MEQPDISKCPCNNCGLVTDHDSIHMEMITEAFGSEKKSCHIYTIICRGCRTPSIRKDIFKDPDDGSLIIEYSPPRSWFKKPEWLDSLESIDPALWQLLTEVYSATNEKQHKLLAMGVRTCLDYVMTAVVKDFGGFNDKIEEMVLQKHISEKQKDMLLTVIDAGSAAAHRGYTPPRELLYQMLLVMETIIRDHYITAPLLANLKTVIPPRPPRVKRSNS